MTIAISYTAPPESVAQNIVQIPVANLMRRQLTCHPV